MSSPKKYIYDSVDSSTMPTPKINPVFDHIFNSYPIFNLVVVMGSLIQTLLLIHHQPISKESLTEVNLQ